MIIVLPSFHTSAIPFSIQNSIDPRRTNFHIGETYRQMGEPEKSIPYYEKAVSLGYEGGLREIEEAKGEIIKKEK